MTINSSPSAFLTQEQKETLIHESSDHEKDSCLSVGTNDGCQRPDNTTHDDEVYRDILFKITNGNSYLSNNMIDVLDKPVAEYVLKHLEDFPRADLKEKKSKKNIIL